MDVYYRVKHKLQAPTLDFTFVKCPACGADGQAYVHVITKISQLDRLPNLNVLGAFFSFLFFSFLFFFFLQKTEIEAPIQ